MKTSSIYNVGTNKDLLKMEIRNIIKDIVLNPKSFFLENLGVKQTIFKNTFWLALAETISRFLKLILIIYVARILGVADYGKFTFALAFVSLFVIFSDFSLPVITTREISQGKEKEYPAILSLKTLLSLGALALILISSFFITFDPVIRKAVWILGIYILISNFSDIIFAFFRAIQKMEYEALAKILQALIITGAGLFAILKFPSVENLSYSYLFASLIVLVIISLFLHFKIYRLNFDWNRLIWRRFLLMSWPLVLTRFADTIFICAGPIMMGYLGQINQVGWYSAAFKITGVTLVPMFLIPQCFYPVLSKILKESKEKFQKIWNYQMEVMIFLSFPLMIGGITLAPKIINFIYGPAFLPSIFTLQILIIMAGIVFLYGPLSQDLIIFNQQEKVFWVTFLGAAVAIILNLILIPKFSFYGAALVVTITSFLLLLLFLKTIYKYTFIKPLNLKILSSFTGSILSSFLMYFVISQPQIYNLNVFLSILIGAIIYSFSFFIFRFFLYNITSTKQFQK